MGKNSMSQPQSLNKVYWLNLSGKKNQEFEYDSLKSMY